MLFVKFHTSFKKDLKKCVKIGKDISKFNIVLDILEKNRFLPFKYKDHKLIGNYKGFSADIFAMFSARKRLEDYSPEGEDNLSQATPKGMPGWLTLNIRLSQKLFKDHLGIDLGVNNIL
jgi:hypothetical protein